jgi:hypothetical protein
MNLPAVETSADHLSELQADDGEVVAGCQLRQLPPQLGRRQVGKTLAGTAAGPPIEPAAP